MMDPKTKAKFDARARIMKALAHPTRLFIVEELSKEEKTVSELTEMIGVDISTVSKHLTVLRSAGLVLDDKRGAQVYFKLRVSCLLNFFDCLESVIRSVAQEQIDLLKFDRC